MAQLDFRPGDHIQRRRLGYDHHAIFLRWVTASEADVVHHPRGKRLELRGKVRQEVKDVSKYTLVQRPSDPDTTLRRALSKVGEDGYNVFSSNCEHFAEWCATGQPRSRQVRATLLGIPQGAVLGGAIGAALVPAATLFGNRTLGRFAVSCGIISAPAKWPAAVKGSILAAPIGAFLGLAATRVSRRVCGARPGPKRATLLCQR
mmetsp:Transcript_89530/g.252266  ORF Transcript_89530/g.252266 Transcript_89530/m.252266 type:complete len:204 (+) Transcript_89530:50-661(+)